MAKPAARASLSLDLATHNFPRYFAFNRFDIVHHDYMVVAKCALFFRAMGNLNAYGFSITQNDLANNLENFGDFLSRLDDIENPSEEDLSIPPPHERLSEFDNINVMAASHSGDQAEIRLLNFTMGAAIGAAANAKKNTGSITIAADPVCVLRCPVSVQKTFLLHLFKSCM